MGIILSNPGLTEVSEAVMGDDVERGGFGPVFPLNVGAFTVVQGTWASGVAADYWFYAYTSNSGSGIDGDEVTFKCVLTEGTYNINVGGYTGGSMGIMEILDGGTSLGTIDWYGGVNKSAILSINAASVTGSGLKTISIKVNGKHASSTDYNIYPCFICFERV